MTSEIKKVLLYFTLLYFTLIYFTIMNSSAMGIEWIHNRTYFLHPVVYFCDRDPHLIVPFRYIVFPAISWPSVFRFPAGWITSPLLWGSCWCHPVDMWPSPDLVLVCSAVCIFILRLISSFLILSILVSFLQLFLET